MRNWLTLALLVVGLSGCYDQHGAPGPTPDSGATDAGILVRDASIGRDGAMECTTPEPASGTVSTLSCPAWVGIGERVEVTVAHAPPGCCPQTAVLPPIVTTAPGSATIEPRWNVCECCFACPCAPSPMDERIVVTEHAEGSSLVVTAGDQSCTIEVRVVGMCHPLPINGYLVPDAVALGEAAPIDLRSDGGFIGCGCTPVSGAAGTTASMSACDCCEDCDCVDFGYEATALVDLPATTGAHFIALGDLEGAGVEVVDRARCLTSGSSGLVAGTPVLAAPAEMHVQARPTGVWVELPVEELRCCGEPLVLADVSAPVDGVLDVTLSECAPDPCDCAPGTLRTASPNVFLGYLPSGEYRVRIGGVETPISVP